jgi:hypothetical protein
VDCVQDLEQDDGKSVMPAGLPGMNSVGSLVNAGTYSAELKTWLGASQVPVWAKDATGGELVHKFDSVFSAKLPSGCKTSHLPCRESVMF